MTEIELIEKTALKVGMRSLLNHGAGSCVYTDGCNGVSQAHLVAFAREVALRSFLAFARGNDAPTSQIKEVPGNPGSVAGEGVGKL